MKRTAYTLAYLCHLLAGGLVSMTNCYLCGVPLELISRGLAWIGR
jgi:hypothetical protein